MSRMTYERALGIVAERTHDNRKDIRQKNLQRRNPVTDLYGIPHYAEGSANDPALFYISVSKDFTYYNRFQFRLAVKCADSVGNFKISMSDTSNLWSIDLTDYLQEQHGGDWIEGTGLYPQDFQDDPTDEDETVDDYYDILDVAQVIQAEMESTSDEDEKKALDVKRRRLLMPGFKEIKIEADGNFTVTLYLYLKYASVNR